MVLAGTQGGCSNWFRRGLKIRNMVQIGRPWASGVNGTKTARRCALRHRLCQFVHIVIHVQAVGLGERSKRACGGSAHAVLDAPDLAVGESLNSRLGDRGGLARLAATVP